MAELQPTDEFLVNRSDTTYTQETDTLMASLETTDYLLVNRSDATYKITGEDFINSVIDPLEVTVIIAPNPPLIRENAEAIPVVTGGKKPDGGYVFTYQWHYADDLLGTNKVDIPGQTASTYVVPESDITKFIGCTVTTTDALNTTASGIGYGGPVSAVEIAPVIDEVILTEIYDGENRFTDKEFPYTTVMGLDGTPDPTFAVKARLSGTTFNFGVESDTITKVEGAGENVYTTDTISNVNQVIDSSTITVGSPMQNRSYKLTENSSPVTAPLTDSILQQIIATPGWTDQNPKDSTYSNAPYIYAISQGQKMRFNFTNADVNTDYILHTSAGTGARGYTYQLTGDVTPTNGVDTQSGENGSTDELKDENTFNVTQASGYFEIEVDATNSLMIHYMSIGSNYSSNPVLTFPTANNFDKFEVGDVVQESGAVWSYVGTDTFKVQGDPKTNFPDRSTWELNRKNDNGTDYSRCYAQNGDITMTWKGLAVGVPTYLCTSQNSTSGFNDRCVAVSGDIEETLAEIKAQSDQAAAIGATTDITQSKVFSITPTKSDGSVSFTAAGYVYFTGADVGFSQNPVSITAIDDSNPYTITVDGGSWYGQDGSGVASDGRYEPHQEWSSNILTGAQFYGEMQPNAFDGSTSSQTQTTNVAGAFFGYTFSGLGVQPVRVFATTGSGSIEVNGSDIGSASGGWVDCGTIELTSIKGLAQSNSPFNSPSLHAVEVNGKLLVDSSVAGGQGDTDITKTVAYNTKLTVASDQDLNIITGGIYMTDGTPKQDGSGVLEPASYTPQTSEIASVNDATATIYEIYYPAGSSSGDTTTPAAWNASLATTASVGVAPVGATPNSGFRAVMYSDRPGYRFEHSAAMGGGTGSDQFAWESDDGITWVQQPNFGLAQLSAGVGYVSDSKYLAINLTFGSQMAAPDWFVGGAESRINLTFNTPNPDLQYFEVGDLVQGAGLTFDSALTESSTALMFVDGTENTEAVVSLNPSIATFNPPLPWNTTIEILTKSGAGATGGYFSVNGGAEVLATYNAWTDITPVGETSGTISTIYMRNGSYPDTVNQVNRFNALRINGVIVNNPSLGDPSVAIIAIDTNANGMTVDGGSWAGTDGSGDVGDGRYEPSQEWSSAPYFTGDPIGVSGRNLENTFNGVIQLGNDAWQSGSQPQLGDAWTLNFTEFTSISKLTIVCWADTQSNTSQALKVNGNPVTVPILNNAQPFDLNIDRLDSISWSYLLNNQGVTMQAIYVDDELLVNSSVAGGSGKTNITGSTETAEGTIQSVAGTEVDLSASSGRWIADNKAGIPFTFVPSTPIVDTQNEAYGKLQIINDKAQVTGIQATDPGFLNVTAKDYSIKFPSVFATGNAPDVDLPAGCAISAIVKAENGAGASVKESNVLLPQTPNPEGSAGPITDVEGGGTNVYTTDTIASVAETSINVYTTKFFGNRNTSNTTTANPAYNDLPVVGTGDDGTQLNTYGVQPASLSPPTAQILAFDIGVELANVEFGHFVGSARNDGGFKLYGTNDPSTPMKSAELLGQVQSIQGPTGTAPGIPNSINSGSVPYRYYFFYGNHSGQNLNSDQNSGITISNYGLISPSSAISRAILTFPTSNNFDKFEVDDVVQGVVVQPGDTYDFKYESNSNMNGTNPKSYSSLGVVDETTLFGSALSSTATSRNMYFDVGRELTDVTFVRYAGYTDGTVRTLYGTNNSDSSTWTQIVSSAKMSNSTDQRDAPVFTNGRTPYRYFALIMSGTGNGFSHNKFGIDDTVFDQQVKITAIDDTVPSITVDGGEWLGSDTSGDPAGDTTVSKTEAYGSKLTVGTASNLDTFIAADALVMVDGTGAVASYTPVTSTITNVEFTQYSQGVTSLSGDLYGTAEALFDGNLDTAVGDKTTTGSSQPTVPFAQISFNFATSPLTSTIGNVRVYLKSNLSNPTANQVQDVSISVNGGAFVPATDFYATSGGTTNEGWQDLGTNNLTTLTIKSTYGGGGSFGAQIYGFETDGEIVTEGRNILTFTDNQDFKFLKAGDKVEAVPVSPALSPAFSTTLYPGRETAQTVTTSIDNTIKSLVWIKGIETSNNILVDNVRSGLLDLVSNKLDAENYQDITAFLDTGFTLQDDSNPAGSGAVNKSGRNYVAWNFKAAPGFFDIVAYEGTGVDQEVPHNLGSAPGFVIVKSLDETGDWWSEHKYTSPKGLKLNLDIPANEYLAKNILGSSDLSKTIRAGSGINYAGKNFVAYLFADTPGLIKCGKESTSGQIECGFKPGWLMLKNSDVVGNWVIVDSARDGIGSLADLYANANSPENLASGITFNDTGFDNQQTTNEFIYIAIAEGAEAGEFFPTGELTADADPAGTTITLTNTTGDWTAEVGSTATGPEKSGVGNFVSTNGTDTVSIENSNNEWISNDNRLGEEFFIKKLFTALNANDPAHVAMQQAVNAAFAAFPQNAAARRTSIASSLYRLMAGETLTAEETTALTSTVITAVNAAEPFALDGYYPLYYTAAAANAASSVGDHHTHDMNGETFYMPDGGTIYHGSYLAPEEEEESSGY